jgi:hypothetical protein
MMQGGGPQIEVASAPHVAEVVRRANERPRCLADRPISVESDLWQRARGELQNTLRERGWPLLVDDRLASRGIDNFICYGIAVVVGDDP